MNSPYLIAVPPYTSRSGGVVSIYQLCHDLRQQGQHAWIVPMAHPFFWRKLPMLKPFWRILPRLTPFVTSPYLDAPVVPMATEAFFEREDIEPIVIYPDIYKGNPLGAKRVVRYLLAAPGDFGGDRDFPETDKVWSFSRVIAAKTRSPGQCPERLYHGHIRLQAG